MVNNDFRYVELHVPATRFHSWRHFMETAPEYSIGLEVIDDTPGHHGHHVHFDHHAGVIREATMSAAMQAYIAVRQGRLMQKWLPHRNPISVYVWNADQDVCLATFILEYHELLERYHADPLLRWIVQFNNKIDVCGGIYPVDLAELEKNHFTWVFEPFRQQRMCGKSEGDEDLVKDTIRRVCNRLRALLEGVAGIAPITAEPEILYVSPYGFVIADEKGDPNSRLVLAAEGYTNLISLVSIRKNDRYTYSVIRGSPYDEDTFQIPKLVQAFQAAEDMPAANIWGGSNLAAGSDSELGSSLPWTKLRDIAERIVEATMLANTCTGKFRTKEAEQPAVLIAMASDQSLELEKILNEWGVEVYMGSSCADACHILKTGIPVRAVFSARVLPDGGFWNVVSAARNCARFVPVIVCLPEVDGGWADLLEAGASDLIVARYQPQDIARVLDRLRVGGPVRSPSRISGVAA